MHSRFSFYQINAVSFARFAFDQEIHADQKMRINLLQDQKKRTGAIKMKTVVLSSHQRTNPAYSSGKKVKSQVKFSQRFLASLERERLSRNRAFGIFIKDLIRITFFSRYLKKANFLASFFAFTISKLPRNRKETTFLRFLRKLLKVFGSQRKEMLGVRVRFQGRVNR